MYSLCSYAPSLKRKLILKPLNRTLTVRSLIIRYEFAAFISLSSEARQNKMVCERLRLETRENNSIHNQFYYSFINCAYLHRIMEIESMHLHCSLFNIMSNIKTGFSLSGIYISVHYLLLDSLNCKLRIKALKIVSIHYIYIIVLKQYSNAKFGANLMSNSNFTRISATGSKLANVLRNYSIRG